MALNIPVVLGSVRDNRKSFFPAKFMVEKLKVAGIKSQLVDFKKLPLPFVYTDSAPSELKGNYPDANVQKWSEIAKAADAFVIIAPEYNHGYSAVLKNALDWLFPEFRYKPVGLVGVSSGAIGGARAIEQLRPIMENFSMFTFRETVMFGPISKAFDEAGKLLDEKYNKQAEILVSSLISIAEIMKKARELG